MRRRTIGAVALITVAIAASILAIRANRKEKPRGLSERRTVRVGHLVALDMAPHFVAKEAGYFEEENLEVKFQFFVDVYKNNEALATGKIDFSINPFTLPYFALQKGVPVRVISSAGGWGVIQIVIHSDFGVSNMKQLAQHVRSHPNEKIKVGSFRGDTLDLILYDAFREEGLTYDQFEMVWFKDLLKMVKAFREKRVDILSHIKPYTTDLIQHHGAVFLADNASVWNPRTPNCVLSVLDSLLTNEPDVVRAYLRAIRKAAQLINTKPEEAVALLQKSDYPHYYQVGYDVVLKALKSQPAPLSFTPNITAVNSVMFEMVELKYIDKYVPGRKIFRLSMIKKLEGQQP